MKDSFTLHIFVVDGDPDGLRMVERSNWNGKAVVFPRTLLPKEKQREEFRQVGVYLLIGPREDGEGEMLYIGEGDPVRPRLESHYAKKDFWTRAVFFVAGPGQLNKARVQYLEAQLIQRALGAKRVTLDNDNRPNEPSLSERDLADMQVFLDNMLGVLPVIGVDAFEQSGGRTATKRKSMLICRGKGVEAKGYEATRGFVVQKGSQAVRKPVPSMEKHVRGMYSLREELIRNGVLLQDDKKYRFTQDYVFGSPSTAASIVLGRSANGRIEWSDAQGRTLKALQEREAGAPKAQSTNAAREQSVGRKKQRRRKAP